MTDFEEFISVDEHHLVIDDTDISGELAMQSARFCYYAERAVAAEREYDLFKQRLSQTRSEVEKKIRAKYLESGAKAPTVQALESEVNTNPGIVAMEHELINLKGKMGVAKSYKDAHYMRKDLLNQMANNKRKELDTLRNSTVKGNGENEA